MPLLHTPAHSGLQLDHNAGDWKLPPRQGGPRSLGRQWGVSDDPASGTTRPWSPARMSDMRRRAWTGLAWRGSNPGLTLEVESFTSRQQIVSRSLRLFVVGYCVLRTINVHICSLFPNIWISLSTGAVSCLALQLILSWGEDWSLLTWKHHEFPTWSGLHFQLS